MKKVLAVLALAAGGCSSGGGDAGSQSEYVSTPLPAGGLGLYVEGQLAERRGNEGRAAQLYQDAANADGSLVLVNRRLGEIARQQNDLDRAEQWFGRYVDRDPNDAQGHFDLAETVEAAGRPEEALEAYERGLNFSRTDYDGNLGAGRVLLALDRTAEAEPYLRTAAEVNPNSGEARRLLGDTLDALGQLDEAAAAYARAVELLPPGDENRYALLLSAGLNASKRGATQEGLDLLAQAEQLRPGDVEASLASGLALAAEGERQRRDGDNDAARESFQTAVDRFETVTAAEPNNVRALNAKGSSLLRLWDLGGRIDSSLVQGAVEAWRASLDADPDQPAVEAVVDRYGQ